MTHSKPLRLEIRGYNMGGFPSFFIKFKTNFYHVQTFRKIVVILYSVRTKVRANR